MHEITPSDDNACSKRLLQAEFAMSVSFHRSGLGNAPGRAAVASKGRHAGRAPVLLPGATDHVDQRFCSQIHVRFAMPTPSKVHQPKSMLNCLLAIPVHLMYIMLRMAKGVRGRRRYLPDVFNSRVECVMLTELMPLAS